MKSKNISLLALAVMIISQYPARQQHVTMAYVCSKLYMTIYHR